MFRKMELKFRHRRPDRRRRQKRSEAKNIPYRTGRHRQQLSAFP
ncbi:MAG: hypothetical protein ACLU9S_21495 [Oscillospiraceae bacterium]